MKIEIWIGLALMVAPVLVNAQRPDCPVKNAPAPMTPPGKPPDFRPQITFPSVWGGEVVRVEADVVVLPAVQNPLEAEEGHLTAIGTLASHARHVVPPADVMAGLVDTNKTPLLSWRFEGYIPNPSWHWPRCDAAGNCSTSSRHKVTRVFSKDGATVLFEQWDMRADGAAVVATAPQTVSIGRFSGNSGGLLTPSGCVSASLSWHGEGRSFKLQMLGPLSLDEQRSYLLGIARSIESVTPSRA